jgi:hypothetical protein
VNEKQCQVSSQGETTNKAVYGQGRQQGLHGWWCTTASVAAVSRQNTQGIKQGQPTSDLCHPDNSPHHQQSADMHNNLFLTSDACVMTAAR